MSANIAGMNPAPTSPKKVYVPAVGPRLRRLFHVVLALVALLGANSIYLVSVTILNCFTQREYQNYFYQYMFLTHLVLGILLIGPLVVFGTLHMVASWHRRNRRAVRIGYALFVISLLVLVSGILLMQVEGIELKDPLVRSIMYWLHIAAPVGSVWLYWLHRLAGPRIKWRIGGYYALGTTIVVAGMVWLQAQDPRQWFQEGPKEGEQYFRPSLVTTATGKFIPARTLMMDQYCEKCHSDAYQGWFHSAHRFSSFNNPAYLASVRETRAFSLKRDGNVKAARWCAGCHDPVPFFSGAFDSPDYDDVNDPTAHAGITCTACHAITSVDSTKGNADFTIEEPLHYPFAYSENPFLQFINQQLVKAKPAFHKRTFLKPFHRTAEFCSTCHKVHLPEELNHYKFLRGQNHYDTYLLSGVSGHGARSFYYPDVAKTNCADCHMPLQESNDFGAKLFADANSRSIHDHLFPAANTALPYLRNDAEIVRVHEEFLKGSMRVDLFGIKDEMKVDGTLHAPLRPRVPVLQPGRSYLLETVVRTLKLGHPFTQGTADSNEVWLDVTVSSGSRIVGRSGGMDQQGEVDPWSHFLNIFMLDREGNRIDRRNPQDIFIPLYNHQIPPGAGQVVHFGLQLPAKLDAPITVEVKLRYRKFDKRYMDFVTSSARPGDKPIRGYQPGQRYVNDLPVVTLASDTITFPVAGVESPVNSSLSPISDTWQRWNDYGIGLLLEGQTDGGKGELRQAEEAFSNVESLGRFDGPLNLARVYFAEGRLDEAVDALRRAAEHTNPPAYPWTIAWITGLVNMQQGHLDKAIQNFKDALNDRSPMAVQRKFDFSLDYEVNNQLGEALFQRARQEVSDERAKRREEMLRAAVAVFEKTIAIDSENVTAHYNLSLLHTQLGNSEKASEHRKLHGRYKVDDNARDRAVALARKKYPAANFASERLVIYPLHRAGCPLGTPENFRSSGIFGGGNH